MIAGFRILDTEWILEGPSTAVGPIASAYRRFSVAPDGLDRPRHVGPPADAALDPCRQLYRDFLLELTRRLGAHALLHAAAVVAPDGRAALIAAPSGRGKSTLSLALVRRGFRLLGDDYAPLALGRGAIAPFPRAVALKGDPPPDLAGGIVGSLLGKTLVDIGLALGDSAWAASEAPLGRVIVLGGLDAPEPWIEGRSTLDVGTRPRDADWMERGLTGLRGIEVEGVGRRGPLECWTVRMRRGGDHAGLAALLEDARVLHAEKVWGEGPRFFAETRARPLERSRAAQLLGRELLNRRTDGRLLERLGSLPALFFELTAALDGVGCFQVQPGSPEDTADRVADLAAGA